jgi:hypothetical protein
LGTPFHRGGEETVSWIAHLQLHRFGLLPPASPALLGSVEDRLGVRFPREYREFLLAADGGMLNDFLFYSVGDGLHPAETLLAANTSASKDYPLFCVGRDAFDDFGFLKSNLALANPPVHFLFHETWESTKVAESFAEFLAKIASLEPGMPFTPSWAG